MIRSKTSSPAQAGIHHGDASAKLSLKYGRLSTMTTSSPRSVASTDSRVRPPFSQASTTREMIGVTGVCRSQSSEVCVMTDATRSSSSDWAIVDPVSMVRRAASDACSGESSHVANRPAISASVSHSPRLAGSRKFC